MIQPLQRTSQNFNTFNRMDVAGFIAQLEESFDDLEPGRLKPETDYRDIEEWSSMHALIVIALADTEYGVSITGDDLRSCNTVEALFMLIKSRA